MASSKLTRESIEQQVKEARELAQEYRRKGLLNAAQDEDARCDTVETLLRALEGAACDARGSESDADTYLSHAAQRREDAQP
jgi:hypothetical protein